MFIKESVDLGSNPVRFNVPWFLLRGMIVTGKLERFTIDFPTVDFDTVLDLLEADLRAERKRVQADRKKT